MDKKQKEKLFKEVTDCFIGQKATLFAYTPSLGGDLYISLEKGGRYFLIKFMATRYFKICQEWNFAGLKIELQPKNESLSDLRYYRIYDRHYLEVSCLYFWVFEILEGEDVVNACINRENGGLHFAITRPEKFKFANLIKNKPTRNITDDFPKLTGAGADLYRYDRWDKLLLLDIDGNKKQDRLFLVCHNCELVEYDGYIHLDKVQIIKDAKIIILKEPSSKFLLRCTSVGIWNDDKYKSYDSELDRNLLDKTDKRYGVRKPIMSVEEIP
ncbi:hypothetical protein [Rivularia sp. PCC 7116]|uniref:hypothetical protein n=1 Tax=Rivularia sp. PCC 7116 TaxID=373994 RepID=UPI0002FDDF1C|nr:hypothetical protein [Rivularia sp. PCC 7116]